MNDDYTPKIAKGVSGRRAKELVEEADRIEAAYRKKSAEDFLLFTRGLTIDGVRGPKLFENCMALFQRECFEDLAPSLHALRDGRIPPCRRWWLERTKKAGKDSDLAIIIIWLIAFPRRPFYAQVGAADREQAGIVKSRVSNLLHHNPWLTDHIEMVRSEIRSKRKLVNGQPMASLDIMSSDIAGSHGGTPDLLIINELSHITKWEFVENLMDNADGVAQGMVIVATNAGYRGTKAEVMKNNALTSEDWIAHTWRRPAPWHDQAAINDAKKRNPPSRFKRLWWGKWPSGKGDAFDEDDIDACFILQGPRADPRPGRRYVAGLDLGISHDHAGFVVTEVDVQEQIVSLCYMKAWEPPEDGEVDLIDVEDTCKAMCRHYNVHSLWYDPHQAKLMAQRLERAGINTQEMTFSSSTNLNRMAVTFLQMVESRKLECFDEDGRLRRDFGKFHIVEKSYGFKLEAVSDEYGHADVGTALVVTLPISVDMLNGAVGLQPDDDLVDDNEEDLTEAELEEMPDDLRDIYDMDAELEERSILRRAKERQNPVNPLEDLL